MSTKKESFRFQIKAVEIAESSLKTPEKPFEKNTAFNFDLNIEHRINIERNLTIVICSVSIYTDNKKDPHGYIKTSCIYEIQNISSYLDKKTKLVILPDELALLLNTLSISTTRGTMASFFRGTILHNAILPLVDPQDFSKPKKITKLK
jgi:hypothetical protein